jgi:A/G-specific adenine glycosylase
MSFGEKIIAWYTSNKRELPWRENPQPYSTWLSEIILQQTRVAQGLPYYTKFITAYPTVEELARAPIDEVLKLWQGLGYYSRARNMHITAQEVVKKHAGIFPSSYHQLIQLKGIGEYTAAAIASICNQEKVAVVDGNVYRVLSRHFSISTPIDTTAGKRLFKELANSLILSPTAQYNQGIMELGALICTPKKAQCTICPLHHSCEGYHNNSHYAFPVKSKKNKVRERYLDYFVIVDNNKSILLHKRQSGDIWEGLYEFPLKEKLLPNDSIEWPDELKNTLVENDFRILADPVTAVHLLSHQKLIVRFIPVHIHQTLTADASLSFSYKVVAHNEVASFPVPQLVHNFLDKHFENLLSLYF